MEKFTLPSEIFIFISTSCLSDENKAKETRKKKVLYKPENLLIIIIIEIRAAQVLHNQIHFCFYLLFFNFPHTNTHTEKN